MYVHVFPSLRVLKRAVRPRGHIITTLFQGKKTREKKEKERAAFICVPSSETVKRKMAE